MERLFILQPNGGNGYADVVFSNENFKILKLPNGDECVVDMQHRVLSVDTDSFEDELRVFADELEFKLDDWRQGCHREFFRTLRHNGGFNFDILTLDEVSLMAKLLRVKLPDMPEEVTDVNE